MNQQLIYVKANQLNSNITASVEFIVYFAVNTWIIPSLLDILSSAGWNSLSKKPVLCRQQSETLHQHQVHKKGIIVKKWEYGLSLCPAGSTPQGKRSFSRQI